MVKFALFQKWVLDHNKNAKRKLHEWHMFRTFKNETRHH